MGRHNGSRVPAPGLRHQPRPPQLDGSNIEPGDRVLINEAPGVRPTPGKVLWYEWRDSAGEWVDPTDRRRPRDTRHGAWRVLVDTGAGPARFVSPGDLVRERITR